MNGNKEETAVEKAARNSKKKHKATGKKGFTKHLHDDVVMCIGFVRILIILSPAVFFSIALGVPYYQITPSACDFQYLGNLTEWGTNPQPIPPATYYYQTHQITDLTQEYYWLVDKPWDLYLPEGVCPTGMGGSTGGMCLRFDDTLTPSVWQSIDLEIEILDIEPSTQPNMVQAAKNMRQALNLLYMAVVVSWVLVGYTIISAINTDENRQHKDEEEVANPLDIPQFDLAALQAPEQMQQSPMAGTASYDGPSLGPLEDGGTHGALRFANVHNVLMPWEEEELEKDKEKTFTADIVKELLSICVMFGFSVSILKLVVESDMTEIPKSWGGWFVSCTIGMEPAVGIGILYYQCVTMGLFLLAAFLAECYYLPEYCRQYNHLSTHPAEHKAIEAHLHAQGLEYEKPEKWTGPVFLSSLHVAKVKAIKAVWHAIVGKPKEEGGGQTGDFAQQQQTQSNAPPSPTRQAVSRQPPPPRPPPKQQQQQLNDLYQEQEQSGMSENIRTSFQGEAGNVYRNVGRGGRGRGGRGPAAQRAPTHTDRTDRASLHL